MLIFKLKSKELTLSVLEKFRMIRFAESLGGVDLVGRVWTEEELTRIGDICLKHGVIVVSDEIHQDFVFKGKHLVFANLKKEYEDISVVYTSPSKTFNIASMMMSNIFIPNPKLKRKFRKEVEAAGISQLGVMGLVACEAAYSKGEEWYQAMISYLADNIEFTKKYVRENLSGVRTCSHKMLHLSFRQILPIAALKKLTIR
jgi:cystathionine beta-lyase